MAVNDPFNPYGKSRYIQETDISKYNKKLTPEDRAKLERRRDFETEQDLNNMTKEVWE